MARLARNSCNPPCSDRATRHIYESADGIRQAAYLFHGVLMNHGFAQGNKRTAYAITEWFLWQNELGSIAATDEEIVEWCYATENQKLSVDQVELWLRAHVKPASGVENSGDRASSQ